MLNKRKYKAKESMRTKKICRQKKICKQKEICTNNGNMNKQTKNVYISKNMLYIK